MKQTNQINIRLTIKDLVSFGRFPYSQGKLTDEDWVHINQALSYMKLDELKDKYRSAQRRPVPEGIYRDDHRSGYGLYFLDEPLNNLDMKHSVEMMKLLKRLVEDFENGRRSDSRYQLRIRIFRPYRRTENGRIVKEGPAEEIIETSVLEDIYDMTIPIQEIDSQRIGVYFS